MAATYWIVQLAGWCWHFWWQATGEAIFASVPFSSAAVMWSGVCLTGLLTTDLLRRISRRQRWLEAPMGALVARLTLSLLVLCILAFLVQIGLALAVYGSPVTAMAQVFYRKLPLPEQLFNELLNLIVTYLTWIAVYFSVALMRHRHRVELQQARLSESLQAAELRLLKSQLDPHFLFNALNGVRALIADEPARAQDAVTHLARTLRYTFESGREDLVTLARELEMVEDYLALESLRLAHRLQIVREIDSRASAVRVPVMLLQGLIENAIKHGIAQLREGGTLRFAARVDAAGLVIEVENPRPGQPDPGVSCGVGLRNAARRLELLFGARASLQLDLSHPRRALALARLPA